MYVLPERAMKSIKSLALISALAISPMLSASAVAMPFTPVIDEFWTVKNGVENYRDSFSDGVLPPSGPDDGITTSGNTYTVQGSGGFTSEVGGKLTMTPALGTPTLITGSTADTFVGARRQRSTNPVSSAFLGFGDSFEIHGLFDLSAVPTVSGQQFGIRASDRSGTNGASDVAQLSVIKSSISGNTGIRFADLDFIADTSETAGFLSIESFLATAVQIELIISKQASSDLVDASFILYDAANSVIHTASLDNINNTTGFAVDLYNGEDYTRSQFFATDTGVPIPEPGALLIFGLGLAGLGFARSRRAA
jgi:hypothetical protein